MLFRSGQRWTVIADEICDIKTRFGQKTALGKRRTEITDAPVVIEVPAEAMVEKEPITVICSAKGWIRAVKGHVEDDGSATYKEGDRARFWFPAESTDKLSLFASNGRFYTIPADKLPRGRGHGEPVKLMVDMGENDEVLELRIWRPGEKLLVASHDGRGFIVASENTLAQTKKGRAVLTLPDGESAVVAVPAVGDTIAVVGENHKLLLFPRAELPEMARGRGVMLQRYSDGGLSDAKVFNRKEGLSWKLGGRERVDTAIREWMGARAQAGRLAPKGFPRSNRFDER